MCWRRNVLLSGSQRQSSCLFVEITPEPKKRSASGFTCLYCARGEPDSTSELLGEALEIKSARKWSERNAARDETEVGIFCWCGCFNVVFWSTPEMKGVWSHLEIWFSWSQHNISSVAQVWMLPWPHIIIPHLIFPYFNASFPSLVLI